MRVSGNRVGDVTVRAVDVTIPHIQGTMGGIPTRLGTAIKTHDDGISPPTLQCCSERTGGRIRALRVLYARK